MSIIRSHTEDNSVIQIPESVLHQDLARMLKDREGTDVTFSVGDRFFHAHRYVLAARSKVFKAQLFGTMKEEDARCIKVDNMEPAAFEGLLHYIYTDSLSDDCTVDRIVATQHLLVAADRYGLDRLRVMCDARLSGWIDVQSVATTLALAEQHQCARLEHDCLMFLRCPDVLRAAMKTEGFNHLIASYPSVASDVLEMAISARIDQ
ncbi:BTB/POZ and MATH domain-containing protein 2-like [Setaria viridis]